MIDSTLLFQEAIERDSRSFHARFLVGSSVVDGDLRSVTVHKGSTGESEFNPGAVFCPYIEAVVDNCAVALEGQELQLQIGIMTNTDLSNPVYEYLRIGMFRVGKPSTSRHRTTFTAHGRIASCMNGLFTPPQTMTLAAVASAIASQTGVLVQFASGIDTSLPIRGTIEDMTCREALSVIASVVGGYATETATGDAIIRLFDTTVTAEYTQDVMTEAPTFADYDTEITGVEVIVLEPGYDEEGEETEGISYTYGDPVNVEVSNPYMTEEAFEDFRDNIVGLEYRSGHVPLTLGDPRIEPWDTVQVTTIDEDVYVVPCMEISIVYDGGVRTTIDAPGLRDETQMEGSVARAVRTAVAAGSAAANARRAADQAESDARAAATAASSAQSSASAAQTSANNAAAAAAKADAKAVAAGQAASAAQTSANNANEYAARALGNLSTVQSVAETLTWITQHGTMTLTTDTELDPTHVYFVQDASGDYVVGSTHYAIVTEPSADDLASYYVLSIDESLQNYVGTHLALTSEGLWILPEANGYKILIATGSGTQYTTAGTYIVDASGTTVAVFGADGVQIGADDNSKFRLFNRGIYGYNNQGASFFSLDMDGSTASTVEVFEKYTADKKYWCNKQKLNSEDCTITITGNFTTGNWNRLQIRHGYKDGRWQTYSESAHGFGFVYGTAREDYYIVGAVYDQRTHELIRYDYKINCSYDGDKTIVLYIETMSYGYDDNVAYYYFYPDYLLYSVVTPAPAFTFGTRDEADVMGDFSTRLGIMNVASGAESVAMGNSCEATGAASHAQNLNTIAASDNQTAIGKYNTADSNDEYAFIIGNGSSIGDRSNALTVGWNGTIKSADGFDSSKPPYKWKPFVSEEVTLAANGSTTYTVTGVTLPTIDGYTRFVIPRASRSQAVVTGFGFDANDNLTVFLRNLTSSSVSFTVRGILMYLDNNNRWT